MNKGITNNLEGVYEKLRVQPVDRGLQRISDILEILSHPTPSDNKCQVP